MSVRSLTTLAVARDIANKGTPVKGGSAGADNNSKSQSFADALTSAIPTEPLAAYTALVAIMAGLTDHHHFLTLRWWVYGAFLALVIASIQISYSYKAVKPPEAGDPQQPDPAAANAAAPDPAAANPAAPNPAAPNPAVPNPAAANSKKPRRMLPLPEILSATIAAAAWGLVTPGSGLQTMLKGQTAIVTAACITIGGAALVSLMAPILMHPSKATPLTTAPNGSQGGDGG